METTLIFVGNTVKLKWYHFNAEKLTAQSDASSDPVKLNANIAHTQTISVGNDSPGQW